MQKKITGFIMIAAMLVLVACGNRQTAEQSGEFNRSTTQTIASGKLEGKKDADYQSIE
ncbi:MAG: hypothetical protein Q4A55_05325 [Aerococcus sp.]|nr:hypothetical protein [Aerococcus sp.]